MGEEESDPVRSIRRESGIIPLLFKDFILHWRDIETSRQAGTPLDAAAAAAAAAFCADAEDDLIFNARKTNHDELVKVGLEDGEKLYALKQWMATILRLFKDAPVELNPAQFTIDIKIGSMQVCRCTC